MTTLEAVLTATCSALALLTLLLTNHAMEMRRWAQQMHEELIRRRRRRARAVREEETT